MGDGAGSASTDKPKTYPKVAVPAAPMPAESEGEDDQPDPDRTVEEIFRRLGNTKAEEQLNECRKDQVKKRAECKKAAASVRNVKRKVERLKKRASLLPKDQIIEILSECCAREKRKSNRIMKQFHKEASTANAFFDKVLGDDNNAAQPAFNAAVPAASAGAAEVGNPHEAGGSRAPPTDEDTQT